MLLSWLAVCACLMLMGERSYPIPVDCRSTPHEPTIANAPVYQEFGYFDHVGVDYEVILEPVYTVMDGIVVQVVHDSHIYGRFVSVLQCDGYLAMYAHLSKTLVQFGDVVKAGQLIALSGGDPTDNIDGDGQSTGYHLHFELRTLMYFNDNTHNIDPLKYLEQSRENMQSSYMEYMKV